MNNESIFAKSSPQQPQAQQFSQLSKPDYSVGKIGVLGKTVAFLIGFGMGFLVVFIFYMVTPVAVIAGGIIGVVNIFAATKKSIKKRLFKLRGQFFDLLEAMSVSMRAGSPPFTALQSAREDLLLIYSVKSDIIVELDIIVTMFQNNIPLSESLNDFAERSKLEDIASFASIYATIEGKAGNTGEIVRQTQEIISDKMEIEMEIETMMTAAKSEVNIMLFMPLVILVVISALGGGFMDAIYTEPEGRVVATVGLAVFIGCYIMAKKFSDIKL